MSKPHNVDLILENVKLRKALEGYAECCDGCTCGDGWSHDAAIEALSKIETNYDKEV